LIPLFAVGAFTAFTLSQSGMVVHWRRHSTRKIGTALIINSMGATFTGAALIIIIVAKFVEGAWLSVIIVPAFVWIFRKIHAHYKLIAGEVAHPVELAMEKMRPAVVVVPIEEWNRISEKAVRLAFEVSTDISAVHISTDEEKDASLKRIWEEKVAGPALSAGRQPPRLEIIHSPYRLIYQPILDYVQKVRNENPGRIVAIVLPELVEPHWYEYILHNLHASGLRTLLFMEEDDRTIVINAPWYLHHR
jgi:hypothetical protein